LGPDLVGKNIIVTGASRGLGFVIARNLAGKGANLLLVARDITRLESSCQDLQRDADKGAEICFFDVNLNDTSAIDKIVRKARGAWDSLHGLVNNAGILGPIGKVWENDWDAWQETIEINLLAPVALCRACIPWMAESGGGRIVNLSGGGATGPRPNFSAYAVSKTGIVRFTEILAEEVRDLNIQVNCIAPGALNTDMLQAVLASSPAKAGASEHESAVRQSEEGGADPKIAAELCAFLMSSGSDKITGKLISALWDPWKDFEKYAEEIAETDIYNLRRIVPRDRGKSWGDSI
jgi:3-oxoacyl-[acyl-carrier protein] reductase